MPRVFIWCATRTLLATALLALLMACDGASSVKDEYVALKSVQIGTRPVQFYVDLRYDSAVRCLTQYGDNASFDRATPNVLSGGPAKFPKMDVTKVTKVGTIKFGL